MKATFIVPVGKLNKRTIKLARKIFPSMMLNKGDELTVNHESLGEADFNAERAVLIYKLLFRTVGDDIADAFLDAQLASARNVAKQVAGIIAVLDEARI